MNEKNPQKDHKNDVCLSPMEKDGDKMMASINDGNMIGILSGNEVMYTFVYNGQYRCFIHKFDAEDGRQKAFPMDEPHKAVIKNLANLADELFEIQYHEGMHPMGVMFAAEQGIIRYLDVTGKLPVEDIDFMAPLEEGEKS